MELELITQKLSDFIKINSIVDLHFYLFGSFLKSNNYIDIDLLIVYKDIEKAIDIKKKILNEFENYLIHITCLSVNEEKELEFINKVEAIKLK